MRSIFLDICVDVSQIEPSQAHEMNQVAQKYGLLGADYFSFLTQDVEEAETLRQARKQEEEKAMYSVRFDSTMNCEIRSQVLYRKLTHSRGGDRGENDEHLGKRK